MRDCGLNGYRDRGIGAFISATFNCSAVSTFVASFVVSKTDVDTRVGESKITYGVRTLLNHIFAYLHAGDYKEVF